MFATLNTPGESMAYGIPLHQLTNNQTKLWLLGGEVRRGIANKVVAEYPTGCGIVAWRGQLIAYVSPRQDIRELAPPFRRVSRDEVANKPSPTVCACQNFWDPEVGGPWKLRGTDKHHPFCQFDKHSQTVYRKMQQLICEAGGSERVRPDEHLRLREQCEGHRGEKTGARHG
jgi:hypothetical protein